MHVIRERLNALALNLWWTWQPDVIQLFRDLDPDRWRKANHNPLAVLTLSDAELRRHIVERSLAGRVNYHYRRLQDYLSKDMTHDPRGCGGFHQPVAYFSAEFALHESLPLYSGGLGVLAGDFLKSASDLGLPMIGVGLYYANGYFRQRIDETGWQHEEYDAVLREQLPLIRAAAADGSELTITVQCGDNALHAAVWLAHVGRVRLLLLDTNVPANTETELRDLSSKLYGGDERTRIRQEILLGIGGVRALRAVGIAPGVWHLNEGHSAFAMIELVRERMANDGVEFAAALREVAMETVFTTHTPVAAGHDRFSADLIERQLGWLRTALGMDLPQFMANGRVRPADSQETFCLTALALKARQRNGVSALHGHVARQMWQAMWPERVEADVPIGHITNGVHMPSWIAPSIKRIYDHSLGADWASRQADPATWLPIADIDDGELWEAHTTLRRELADFVARRPGTIGRIEPDILTVGFARRFATYKRADLLLADIDRLVRLCQDTARPIQFVIAGKAHPRDDDGKRLIQRMLALARDRRLSNRFAFIEDYDLNVGRHLVRGVDVWLNTPARPLEACGTSGQKIVLNGGLNCSILDGWWAEAYDGYNGFAVGTARVHSDWSVQWGRDAAALMDVLANDVRSTFHEAGAAGVPTRWLRMMKHAVTTLGWRFSADRMVADYVRTCYARAAGTQTCAMQLSSAGS